MKARSLRNVVFCSLVQNVFVNLKWPGRDKAIATRPFSESPSKSLINHEEYRSLELRCLVSIAN